MAWTLVTNIKGNVGSPGPSAYQVAVDAGFSGTQSQWLASLVGAKGDTGTMPQPVAIDTDGTPYASPDSTHMVVIDTTGEPIVVEGDAVTREGAGGLELAYAPTPVFSKDETVALVDSGTAANIHDPESATAAALEVWSAGRAQQRVEFNVRDYGAKGDNETDDHAAFTAAFQAAVANGGGTIRVPAGKYILGDEWNVYRPNSPRVDIVIAGDDQLTTWVQSSFYGAGKALVNGRSPDGTRLSPLTLKDLQFRATSINEGANPVMVEIEGWGESRFDSIRFGPSNNTHWRASSIQNLRSRDVTSYYGGKNFVYRATDGAVFAVDSATRTITADRDVFQSNDEGMAFFIIPSNNLLRIMYTLGEVIGPREARIADDTRFQNDVLDATNSRGGFDAARASMTAGSPTLTANAPCFSPTDVGRVLVVRNARQGAWGPAMLRGRIISYTSATQVVLDRSATLTVSQAPFAQPVIDFWVDKSIGGMASVTSTDVKIKDFQVEAYAGLSLSVIDSIQFHMTEMKMHGEHDPIDARNSTGMAWFDDVGGTFSGDFDGASTSDVRMHFSNMNETLSIPYLASRRYWNEPLLQAEEMLENGAMVQIGTFVSDRHDDHGPLDFIIDKNVDAGRDPKIVFTGPVTMIGGNTPPRIYHGMGLWTDTAGRMVMTSPDGTEYRVGVSDAGAWTLTPFEGME